MNSILKVVKKCSAFLILPSLLVLSSQQALALKIIAVKSNKVMIDIEKDSLNLNERFFAIDENGKKKGLLIIKKIKGDRALAEILKGNVQIEFSLQLNPGVAGEGDATSSTKSTSSNRNNNKRAWGLNASYIQNSMTVKPSGETVNMTGSSYGLLGFYQVTLDRDIAVRGSAGYQGLTAKGSALTAVCTGSKDCGIDLSYLNLDALVRYTFFRLKNMNIWAGAGISFLLAVNKSSNAVETSKITTNQSLNAEIGLDFFINKNQYIPLELHYGLFPSTSSSSANQISLTTGYGWTF